MIRSLFIFAFAFLLGYFMREMSQAPPPAPPRQDQVKSIPAPPAKSQVPIPSSKQVAVVIDDIGWMKGDKLGEFIKLGIPLTFAILPGEPYSRKSAEEVHAAGQEVILHLPLEPEDVPHNDPGPQALLTSMSAPEIRKTLRDNINSVPHVIGVNNHMGSRFISDRRGMQTMMNELKSLGLFFMDSRTSPKSVAKSIAHLDKVPYLENQVFLDNVDTQEDIIKQLRHALSLAEKGGHVVAIGHIQRVHILPALKVVIPEFQQKNVNFVPISFLLKKTDKNIEYNRS